jgi:hypothetical protein
MDGACNMYSMPNCMGNLDPLREFDKNRCIIMWDAVKVGVVQPCTTAVVGMPFADG